MTVDASVLPIVLTQPRRNPVLLFAGAAIGTFFLTFFAARDFGDDPLFWLLIAFGWVPLLLFAGQSIWPNRLTIEHSGFTLVRWGLHHRQPWDAVQHFHFVEAARYQRPLIRFEATGRGLAWRMRIIDTLGMILEPYGLPPDWGMSPAAVAQLLNDVRERRARAPNQKALIE